MEAVGTLEPVITRGRSRRGATSRTQPRCSRSNQTRDQQGSEVAEQRPQRSRCLRGRRQHPCHSSRNENENLSSAERPSTASTSSRRRTSTRGRPMAAENSRSRRAENREQRLESISSQSDQSSNHSGLAFRLLRRLSSAMQSSLSSADFDQNNTVDINDASLNTTNDGSGYISDSTNDSITSGSVDRNRSDDSVIETSSTTSDRDSSLNIVSSGSDVSGIVVEPLDASGNSSTSSQEVNARPARYSVITLDTTNDYEAPPNRNHGDSIVMVDSDTDTDYEEVIIVEENVPEVRRERNKTNANNSAQPKPSVSVDENKNNENGVTIECPVCITSLQDIKKSGLTMQSTLCGHIFCSQCLTGLFQDNQTRTNCPLCRKPIKRKEIHPIFIW